MVTTKKKVNDLIEENDKLNNKVLRMENEIDLLDKKINAIMDDIKRRLDDFDKYKEKEEEYAENVRKCLSSREEDYYEQ